MSDPYLSANGTLKNNLGIEDADELADAEDHLSVLRLAQIDSGLGPRLTGDCLKDLKAIHGFVFKDVYSWAGKTRAEPFTETFGRTQRSVTTNFVSIKGSKAFAGPRTIAARLEEKSASLRQANGFRNMKRRDFVTAVADLLIDINDTHAFREGNGRTQRALVEHVCKQAERPVDFTVITQERMVHASVAADHGDRTAMKRLIRDATSPERIAELKKAQAFMDKAGYDWRDRYVGFVEPRRHHVAKLVAVSGKHFACVEDNRSILIGWRRDLPGGRHSAGQNIRFVGRGASTDAIAKPKSVLGR